MNEAKHSLTDRDISTMTATCSVCGPVGIRTAGNGYQCSVKKAANHAAWAKANPEKAAANRRTTSGHRLSGKDTDALQAMCSLCGPVAIVAWGRGYACAELASSRRSVQQAEPMGWCRDCKVIDGTHVWLRVDGTCRRCTDNNQWSHLPAERRDRRPADDMAWLGLEADEDEAYGTGFGVGYADDPYTLPERESAVPGWKTLGSSKPWNEV